MLSFLSIKRQKKGKKLIPIYTLPSSCFSAERQRNRMYGSLSNLAMNPVNGHAIDLSRLNGTLAEDTLGNKLRAELDRSIAKHLEAGEYL